MRGVPVRVADPEAVAKEAVDLCMARGAAAADARVVRLAQEALTVQDGRVREADAPEDFGLAVRVLKDGAVGFAAAPGGFDSIADVAQGVARRALAVARDVAPARRVPVELAGDASSCGEYHTAVDEDPFLVPLEEKLDLLMRTDAALSGRREVVSRSAGIGLRREEQWMVTSDGGLTHQVLVRSGGHAEAIASARGIVERRSHPNGLGGQFMAGGYEVVRGLELESQAERVRDEAIALCHADPCPDGVRTLILGGAQLALQIHESVGHPLELDRLLGGERDLAGGSFATTDQLGHLRYGSKEVTFVADSTVEGGLDSRGWDDDGTPSGRFDLVREGRLVGVQSGRASAGRAGLGASTSSSRAEGWYAPPIDRITNVSLAPGHGTLDDLLANTEDGAIFADTVKSWSIDQERRNFQFTCEIAWEIRGGRRARLLRLPTYQGSSVPFWRSCDAIAGPSEWELHGVVNCGKGNPMQIAEMSHGAAPARFRKVRMLGVGPSS
ncbi:MAG: TldD/PmbA family protein [Planctomycetota bacterium]|nr:TldD/PmbA family protein [Planctomycetota bacterium]